SSQEGVAQEGRQARVQEGRVSRQEGQEDQVFPAGPERAQERPVRVHALAQGQPLPHHEARHVRHRRVQAGRSRMEGRQGQEQVGEGRSRGQEEIREGVCVLQARRLDAQEGRRQEDRQEISNPS
ncbi:hypothetical protein PENTCL1PPCAC_28563, partial [Pristionchus entomophagus]